MGNKWKKRLIIALVAVMTFLQCSPMLSKAAEAQRLELKCSDISAERGDTIEIPVKLHSDSAIKLGGLKIVISYGSNVSYVQGSEKTIISAMKKEGDTTLGNSEANHRVTFMWTSTNVITLSNDVVCVKPSFKVKENAATKFEIKLKIEEAYTYEGTTFRDLQVPNPEVTIKVSIGNASAIKGVEDLINAIGTVTYTDECLDKIMKAASAYSTLTNSQKEKVSNYEKLSAAMLEYERLRIEAEDKETGAEISAFIEANEKALNLTVDTVKMSDEEIVLKALEDFEALSTDAQSKIYSYKRTLNHVSKKIETLKLEEEARKKAEEKEAKQRKEAKGYAEAFKEEFQYFLELKPENLVKDHYTGLDSAVAKLNMLSGLNPYVDEYLKAEKIIINNLHQKVQELMKQEDSATEDNSSNAELDADNFRTSFAYVLSLTEDTITVDDLLELRVAEAVYYELDAEVQNLLQEEFEIITNLLSLIDELPDADADGEHGVAPIIQQTSGGFLDNLTMRFNGRQMGAIVWILLLLLILSMIMFATLQVVYHVYKKGGANHANFKKEAD